MNFQFSFINLNSAHSTPKNRVNLRLLVWRHMHTYLSTCLYIFHYLCVTFAFNCRNVCVCVCFDCLSGSFKCNQRRQRLRPSPSFRTHATPALPLATASALNRHSQNSVASIAQLLLRLEKNRDMQHLVAALCEHLDINCSTCLNGFVKVRVMWALHCH